MDPERWFHERATAYVATQILYHLGASGVVAMLAEGPQRAETLAERLDLHLGHLTTCLEYIAAVETLVEQRPDSSWALTPFGQRVLARYSRATPAGTHVNLFNVRVGSYAPVWHALGGLLDGTLTYGQDIHRAGENSARALHTICKRMAPAVRARVDELGARQFVEVGVASGMLEHLSGLNLTLWGLDRDASTIASAEHRRSAASAQAVEWLEHDLFDLGWTARLDPSNPGVIFSVHFHEILAAGEDRFIQLLRGLGQRLPGWSLLAAEQPHPVPDDAHTLSRADWLYANSNVLIHHLIGNGRILTDRQWRALFAQGGLKQVQIKKMDFLGYQTYAYRFPLL